MYRGNLLQYLHFQSAEAQNPHSVLLTPRPGSIPCQSTQNLGCLGSKLPWRAVPLAFADLVPLSVSVLFVIKSTQGNTV